MTNLNKVKEKVTKLELGGKERSIRYDLNAIAELEDKFGSLDVMDKKLNSGSIKALRTFLWAGLIHEDENLTEKEVGKWFTPETVKNLTPILNEAFGASLPEVEGDEGKNVESQTQPQ